MPNIPITIDAAHLAPNVTPAMVSAWQERLKWASNTLTEGTGAGCRISRVARPCHNGHG